MDKNVDIYIFTEATYTSGLGHFVRCSAIYSALIKKKLNPCLVIYTDGVINDQLKDYNFISTNWIDNYLELATQIQYSKCVIIDSYLADENVYLYLSANSKLCLYIDDNIRISYPKGIIVNGTLGAENFAYNNSQNDKLLGTKYIPLRNEFSQKIDFHIKEYLNSFLITFGGDDIVNCTPKILKHLVEKYPETNKNVIIGSGFTNIQEIEKVKDNKTKLYFNLDANQMISQMKDSDICITASGQTLYELACVGIPSIAVLAAENQINNYKNWVSLNFIKGIGWYDNVNLINNLEESIQLIKSKDVRLKMSNHGRSLVDGKGAERIAENIKNNYYEYSNRE